MQLKYRNVNDAFHGLVKGFHEGHINGQPLPLVTMSSRAGEVISINEPMTITYEQPRERVLFNQARDCNPFFHLYEALWMLAGRNDVAPLAYYNSQISDIASDDGETFNGAYGYRWRRSSAFQWDSDNTLITPKDKDHTENWHDYVDQLKVLIDHLKRNPWSRRAVLQMWNVEDDLSKIDPCIECPECLGTGNNPYPELADQTDKCCKCGGLGKLPTKDVCCNTCVYFAVESGICSECGGVGIKPGSVDVLDTRQTTEGGIVGNVRTDVCSQCNGTPHDQPRYLNMTVCNRSNDLIWGMLGANVVHFSFLQEYMAAQLGLEVGVYNQFTNNLHVYTERWEPEKWLASKKTAGYLYAIEASARRLFPLVQDPQRFDREVVKFIDDPEALYEEPFLSDVAAPMCLAFRHHKEREYMLALEAVERVAADDWKIAGRNWLLKRKTNWERKHGMISDPVGWKGPGY